MNHNIDILMSLFLIISSISFLSLIGYYINLKHKEKMELIKKGDILFENTSLMENMKYASLSRGILLVALSLGLITSFFFTASLPGKQQLILYIAICSLFVGIGSLVFYLITKRKD